MKKAVIVTPFDNYSYNVRIKFVEEYLQKIGYNVKILSSDFDHRNKEKYQNNRKGLELLKVPEYRRNLSLSRIQSHRIFARKSVKRALQLQPDLLYVSGPPNFLFKYFATNKSSFKGTKLIFELGDMWPETMPINGKKKTLFKFPMKIWASLRDEYIAKADFTIFECDLFKELVNTNIKEIKGGTIYLCKDGTTMELPKEQISNECIELVYVGSINNIIDVDLIVEISKKIAVKKKTIVHIIGDGEQRQDLISELSGKNIEVNYHGIVYDEVEKSKIYSRCSFAFNIMKETVCVGLTMKSIDYFEAGLPLINNISGDTHDLVVNNRCGYNVDRKNLDTVVEKICAVSMDEVRNMKKASRDMYDKYFSKTAFEKQFEEMMSKL
ncbi:glycosyltransferase [Enterococcus lactis]|uniref:glycosyltransferase n=1 Tax=Enterococcus TaxID=1350 RepID=UPI0002A30F06|nr:MULTISPECIES: glycosyltransferase [Enterococcus]MBX8934791.1 glycosyltransferase family 4 protein [Enterobacter sp. K62_1]EGP4844469.1 glycosyltransferase family 4 protein [Enterococcus faecium]EGP4945693.1 glycosyltransferase family 4 protein [Enterococcus faecium]EGP5020237.1 glycosyltransferase family 4 protein [Enterococcus faecium]EGP5273698.1 glycosyltransferase [Enterococcus faecium]